MLARGSQIGSTSGSWRAGQSRLAWLSRAAPGELRLGVRVPHARHLPPGFEHQLWLLLLEIGPALRGDALPGSSRSGGRRCGAVRG